MKKIIIFAIAIIMLLLNFNNSTLAKYSVTKEIKIVNVSQLRN